MGDSYRSSGSGRPYRDRDRRPSPSNYRRGRSRSPPRGYGPTPYRDRSPRRDDRRDDRRDFRRERPRSPERRRSRSPEYRRRSRSRSPPQRNYRPDPRDIRSPDRRDSRYGSSNYRRDARPPARSLSPYPRESSGKTSENPSRISSPQIHPSRLGIAPALRNETSARSPSPETSRNSSPKIHPSRLSIAPALRSEASARSPQIAPQSPQMALPYRDNADRDSARSTPRKGSPARRTTPRSPPRGPVGLRAPTGPGSRNISSTVAPPVTPSSSVSIHPRHESSTPTGPRGYVPTRGVFGGRGRGRGQPFGSERSSRSDWGAAPSRPAIETFNRGSTPINRPGQAVTPASPSTTTAPLASGPSPTNASIPTGPSGGIPTGPRAGNYGQRVHSISAASGPRPHPAMANLPQLIPNGREDPTMSGQTPAEAATEKKRKEEEVTQRAILEAKQAKLRRDMKSYNRTVRDSASLHLKSELSESHVRMLAGEGLGGAAF